MPVTDSWHYIAKSIEIFLAVLIVNAYVAVLKLPVTSPTGELETEKEGRLH